MMLHNDEGYQKDVGDPKAMDVILTELKRHPDRLPRYALSQSQYPLLIHTCASCPECIACDAAAVCLLS